VTLLESEVPAHPHSLNAAAGVGNRTDPVGNSMSRAAGAAPYVTGNPALVTMSGQDLAPTGGDQPHNNMQPYLTLNFCIALQGVYPPRG
jgi:microcystin-dependent protein